VAKYKLSGSGVIDTERMAHIPNDPLNIDWQEYQEWLETPENVADPQYTEQEIEEMAWISLRSERNSLLMKTDFMVLQDVFTLYTTQEQTDVTTYRQALRDLPDNTVDPASPTWPTKPQIVIDAIGE
jgi:hypothetical protein